MVNPVLWLPPASVSQGPHSTLTPSHCRVFNFSFTTASKSYPTVNQHGHVSLHLKELSFSPMCPLSFLSQTSFMSMECILAISLSSLFTDFSLTYLQSGIQTPSLQFPSPQPWSVSTVTSVWFKSMDTLKSYLIWYQWSLSFSWNLYIFHVQSCVPYIRKDEDW